jgi:hypothetical protein
LTLGIPSNAVMALMIGAMMIQGIAPGPQVMNERPQLFWGMIASMWVGNLMLVVLNLPLIGIWIKLLTVPYRSSTRRSSYSWRSGVQHLEPAVRLLPDVAVRPARLRLRKARVRACASDPRFHPRTADGGEPAPAMLLSRGDPMVFLQKPISATFIVISVVLLIIIALPALRKTRDEAFAAEEAG